MVGSVAMACFEVVVSCKKPLYKSLGQETTLYEYPFSDLSFKEI